MQYTDLEQQRKYVVEKLQEAAGSGTFVGMYSCVSRI